VITVDSIHKRFGSVHAVNGVTFAAGNGRVTGLLGPNGAGKTTTLRMLYAVMRPDDLSAIAKLVGVGRGTDLVLYALVVAFMAGMFSFYQRFRVVDRRYTELARTVALREAELVNAERGLQPAPAVVVVAAEHGQIDHAETARP